MDERYECEVCGEECPADSEHDHSADAVVMRDGWRGQYLAPTLVLDVEGLVPGTFPRDILDAAERWLAQMGPAAPDEEPSDDEYEMVLDASTYRAEQSLSDHGYSLWFEDGYVIYRIGGDAS